MDVGEWEALFIGVLATGVLAAGAFYVLRLLRRRQARARLEGPSKAEFASDRAYNRLAMARREADVLEHQGVEVSRARDLIGLADASFRNREFDRSFELAQSAHETLVALRRQGARPAGAANPAADGPIRSPARPTVDLGQVPEPAAAPAPAVAALPKNKLESQFQLRLLEGELGSRAGASAAGEARALFDQGQSAFAREDFTEALRLALKGRRLLGGAVETLGPSARSAATSPLPSSAAATEARETAERVAASARCSNCGHPVVSGDAFCRGCGQPLGAARCPQCGAERRPSDAFCGRCGQRYS